MCLRPLGSKQSPNKSYFQSEGGYLSRSHVQDAYTAQLRLFLGEVRQQSQLLALRPHLALHSTVTISKLAHYINAPEATVRY